MSLFSIYKGGRLLLYGLLIYGVGRVCRFSIERTQTPSLWTPSLGRGGSVSLLYIEGGNTFSMERIEWRPLIREEPSSVFVKKENVFSIWKKQIPGNRRNRNKKKKQEQTEQIEYNGKRLKPWGKKKTKHADTNGTNGKAGRPYLYQKERASLFSTQRRQTPFISKGECVSFSPLEKRQTLSISKGESVSLL